MTKAKQSFVWPYCQNDSNCFFCVLFCFAVCSAAGTRIMKEVVMLNQNSCNQNITYVLIVVFFFTGDIIADSPYKLSSLIIHADSSHLSWTVLQRNSQSQILRLGHCDFVLKFPKPAMELDLCQKLLKAKLCTLTARLCQILRQQTLTFWLCQTRESVNPNFHNLSSKELDLRKTRAWKQWDGLYYTFFFSKPTWQSKTITENLKTLTTTQANQFSQLTQAY